MRRRTFLAASATGIVSLSGCADSGPGGDGNGATTTDRGPTTTDETTTTDRGPTTTDGTTTTDSGPTTTNGTTTGDVTVAVRTVDPYGDILVDEAGMTLYLFTRDEDGESVCYDDCAATWPPLTVEGTPTAGEGVTAELGTVERRDGSMQVTAGGWPLYYYASDEEPGDAAGQGVGGVWYVLAPDGTMTEATPSEERTDGSGGAGGSDPY